MKEKAGIEHGLKGTKEVIVETNEIVNSKPWNPKTKAIEPKEWFGEENLK